MTKQASLMDQERPEPETRETTDQDSRAAEPEPEPEVETRPETAVQKARAKTPTMVGQYGVELRDLASLWGFSQMVAKSGLAPKGIVTAEAVAVAIQLGLELGLSPMSALQNIAVINGRPGIYGDAALALVLASGDCDHHREFYQGEGDKLVAVCEIRRRGQKEIHREEFSVADAKQAKLWGKEGPWTYYPKRMLRFRARGFALRDVFPDKLKGIRTVEEIGDYIEIEQVHDAAPDRREVKSGNEAVKAKLGIGEPPPATPHESPEVAERRAKLKAQAEGIAKAEEVFGS